MQSIFILIYILLLNTYSQSAKLSITANGEVRESFIARVKDSLRLTCKLVDYNAAHNRNAVEWKAPQNPRNNQNRIRPFWSSDEASLNISSLQRADSGLYTCICKECNVTAVFSLEVKIHKPLPFCGDNMFVCTKAEFCIAQHYVCDGRKDCKNGEDEDVNECGRDPCLGKIRNCRDGRCIPSTWCCDSELDPNCTVKEKPSCCRQQFKLFQGQPPDYTEYHSFKHGLLKATIFTLFVGAVLFFFLVSICLLVMCRIHIHSCPANQDIREVCARTRIPFYDFYLYLNRNWNNLDHSYIQRPSVRNSVYTNPRTQRVADQTSSDRFSINGFESEHSNNHRSIPHSILLMSYLNNEVQYIRRPVSPPPYSEIGETNPVPSSEPPPPYVSRENLSENVLDNDEQQGTVVRRGYILVTSSDGECDVNSNEVASTSCALTDDDGTHLDNNDLANSLVVVDSSNNTASVEIKKNACDLLEIALDPLLDEGLSPLPSCSTRQFSTVADSYKKKYDIKKLREDFLGTSPTIDQSDSDYSSSEFDLLMSSPKQCPCYSDLENNRMFGQLNEEPHTSTLHFNTEAFPYDSEPSDTSNVQLRETHVVGLRPKTDDRIRKASERPRSLNYDFCLPSGSNPMLGNAIGKTRPLVKCNSGNVNVNCESDPDDESSASSLKGRRFNNGRQLTTRHSIADLSPSGSNEYRYFETPEYDRDALLLTLPLRESFIGLRKD